MARRTTSVATTVATASLLAFCVGVGSSTVAAGACLHTVPPYRYYCRVCFRCCLCCF